LPAADSNGTSDPFVKVWDMSEKQKKTAVIEDNNNPLYYETVEMEYEVRDLHDLESYPPFILDVYDMDNDLFDSSDDYLARAIIEPEDCAINL
jgi:Ca2+-dependent lipid-binding protein